MTIDLVNIADDLAALALRSVLEYWGCTVRLQHIPTAKRLVEVLGGATSLSECVVLMCHGVEEGLVLPELGADIAAQQPYQSAITPEDFREFLRVPDALVINTGCLMGRPEFAKAFLEAGCHSYIGPTDYPEGSASLFYVTHFFYEWHVKKNGIASAHDMAIAHDVETGMHRLYQAKQHGEDLHELV